MTAGQLQKMLDLCNLSQRKAAKILELNERSMRRYCSGEQPVPKTVEYAILWVCSQFRVGSAASDGVKSDG
jgi:hypothetical protein